MRVAMPGKAGVRTRGGLTIYWSLNRCTSGSISNCLSAVYPGISADATLLSVSEYYCQRAQRATVSARGWYRHLFASLCTLESGNLPFGDPTLDSKSNTRALRGCTQTPWRATGARTRLKRSDENQRQRSLRRKRSLSSSLAFSRRRFARPRRLGSGSRCPPSLA